MASERQHDVTAVRSGARAQRSRPQPRCSHPLPSLYSIRKGRVLALRSTLATLSSARTTLALAALRAAIQQFVEANPAFESELYQTQPTQAREPEVVPNRSASGEWTALAQPPMPWLG